jgi:acyl carrier protein
MNSVRKLSRDQVFDEIRRELGALFELEPERIVPSARLYEDLDLDSIDAVDLVVRLQDLTKKRLRPEQFKAVRTVQDVVDAVEQMLAE